VAYLNWLELLSVVSKDLCGPFSSVSIGGPRYLLVIVDNKTFSTSVSFFRYKTPANICYDVLHAIEIMKKSS
jgi:hypothetical protein